jgi:hypothetical protein
MLSNHDNARLYLGLFNPPENLLYDSPSYFVNTRQSLYDNVGMRIIENGLPLRLIEDIALQFYEKTMNYAEIKASKTSSVTVQESASNLVLFNPLLIKHFAYLAANIDLAIGIWTGDRNLEDDYLRRLKIKQSEFMLPVVDAIVALRMIVGGRLDADGFTIPAYSEVVQTLEVPCSEDFDKIVIV